MVDVALVEIHVQALAILRHTVTGVDLAFSSPDKRRLPKRDLDTCCACRDSDLAKPVIDVKCESTVSHVEELHSQSLFLASSWLMVESYQKLAGLLTSLHRKAIINLMDWSTYCLLSNFSLTMASFMAWPLRVKQ